MRIIAGTLRGKKLISVAGTRTRPTADRLREAIFNILSVRVQDAVVLDLFSGTGALGIEALSRGSRSAVFIDNSRPALAAISRNIKACAFEGKARIIRWDITRSLNCISGMRPAFDLVLMDPPYGRNNCATALIHLHHSHCLAPDACLVVEHSLLEPLDPLPEGYAVCDRRKYGKTLVSILSYMV